MVPTGLSSIISSYFPIVMAIVGTIAVALGGLAKFREKRQADLLEATTTWRGLAESRQAALEEAREEIKRLTESERSLMRYIRHLENERGPETEPVRPPKRLGPPHGGIAG